MKDIVFDIEQLICSYSSDDCANSNQAINGKQKEVLKICNLNIYRGKKYFFLGKSGVGKSTLLETLGLMNKTLTDASKVKFVTKEDGAFDLLKVWNNDPWPIHKVRNSFLSFVFQESNFMEDFSIMENLIITQLIQSKEFNTAADKVYKMLRETRLSEIDPNHKPICLSGGQRQRLALIRALSPDFEVLLCDEPTGNLDAQSADIIMHIIKEQIKENKTAIIVSHDVALAMRYADCIVLMTMDNDGVGTVQLENIYERNYKGGDWTIANRDKEISDDSLKKLIYDSFN